MTEQTLPVTEETIKWHMITDDDNIIKFVGKDETFEVTDAVKEFMKKTEISQTAVVKVSISPKGGDNDVGIVERIEVVGDGKTEETKKEEPAKETTEEPAQEAKNSNETSLEDEIIELTVHGVSVDKRNITFKEREKVWFEVADDIDVQKVKDEMTKKKVRVQILQTSGDKDVVTYIELIETTDQSTNEFENNKSQDSSVQKSIESQVAVEHACVVVAQLINSDTKNSEVLTLIKDIATQNYNLMQEFKKK